MRSEISLAQLGEELTQLAGLSDIAPLSEEEVQALEGIVGAPLPKEFRSFLLRFGRGVRPGPVLDLEWITDETLREQGSFAEEPEAAVSVSASFPISRAHVDRLPLLAAKGTKPILWIDKPMPGTMFLCYHGCTWISMLAMNGELAGTVWMTEMGWIMRGGLRAEVRQRGVEPLTSSLQRRTLLTPDMRLPRSGLLALPRELSVINAVLLCSTRWHAG
ncbi:hypothetical protein Skr01_34890 [Sphaerisporangium krabiense]|uniref:Knr4/Smi1-like domain-containing protein n=1 Tax=Sphaerisporangium krabiense TaxID=763782 RepID=A0A7W9DPH9_9ACTN|nr:SMI1/KNR4 family protein [Sphaerisporangium krabiense]MBB5626482.1 hypothetical protein [Sphaerisporangium krabiense]GII63404.1 hypothetical protein Skr01_34890 [Sphaerisporangium krabiense]